MTDEIVRSVAVSLVRHGRSRDDAYGRQLRGLAWWRPEFLTDWMEIRLRRAEALGRTTMGTGPAGSDFLDDDMFAGAEEAVARSPVTPLPDAPPPVAVRPSPAPRPPADTPPPPCIACAAWSDEAQAWGSWAFWNRARRRLGVGFASEAEAEAVAKNAMLTMLRDQWPESTLTTAGKRDVHGIHYDGGTGTFRGYLMIDGELIRSDAHKTYTSAFRDVVSIRARLLRTYVPEDYKALTQGALTATPRGTRRTSGGRWEGRLKWDGGTRYLGTFSTREEAQKAHDDTLLGIVRRGWPSKTSEGGGVHKVGDKQYVRYHMIKTELLETFPASTPEAAIEAMDKILKKRKESNPPWARNLPKGVYESGNKFTAKAVIRGEQTYLGTFTTVAEAQEAIVSYGTKAR